MYTRSILTMAAPAILGTASAFSISASNNVAVYWGQNSYGQGSGSLAQQSLATYCADSNIDIIPMAFLYQLKSGQGGQPVLNFANSQNDCSTFDGTQLINCPQIAADIQTCQQQYGKKLVLSMGGATYTEGGFSSADEANQWADKIWAMFGPVQSGSSELRPFGSSVLDGFDFDFETTVSNSVPFAQRLRSNMDSDGSKSYILTAAPQCPYPDAADNDMFSNGIYFDAIWVQFYNNFCGTQSFTPGSSTQTNFNFETWDNFAKTTSANKDVKIYLGVPAGPSGAGSGYAALSDLEPIIQYCKGFSSFGGVMMWDASQANANSGFLAGVKSALSGSSSRRDSRQIIAREWSA